jgi:hypothetical protein
LISYIWWDEKSENKARYEAINKVLIELQSSDKNQDIKITEINEWRKYYEKAKGEHNTRGGSSSQSPNQLINNIQYVPDETQVAGR